MAFHTEEMAAHAEEMALQLHDGTFQPEEMAFNAQSKLSHPAHLWRRLCRRGGSEEMAFRTAPQSLMHGKSLELTHAAARHGFPTVPSPLSPLYFPAPERMRRGHCYSL